MTSRQARRARKKQRKVLETTSLPETSHFICQELQQIICDYSMLLRSLPVKSYGAVESQKRRQFAVAQSKMLTTDGLSSLAKPSVALLFELGLANHQVSVSFEDAPVTKLMSLVTIGVGAGLYVLLGGMEKGLQNISDSVLAKFSLGEAEAEMFRSLAEQFSGTFDELIEVSRTL